MGEITAAEIDQGFLAHWCDSFEQRNGREPYPQTLRNLITKLRALYGYAERFDLLVGADGQPVRNPMTKIDLPKVKRVIEGFRLTPEEYQQLLLATASPNELFTVVWLGNVGDADR